MQVLPKVSWGTIAGQRACVQGCKAEHRHQCKLLSARDLQVMKEWQR